MAFRSRRWFSLPSASACSFPPGEARADAVESSDQSMMWMRSFAAKSSACDPWRAEPRPSRPMQSTNDAPHRTWSRPMPTSLSRRPRTRLKSASAQKLQPAAHGGISSAAVKHATGKGWDEWCRIIDKAGGAKLDHKQIAQMLHDKYDVRPWWTQMVTVGYEQARGRRIRHQTTSGYSVSASKTLGVSAAGAFLWWKMDRCRKQWLGDADVAVHRATPSKSVRATWNASTAKPVKSISVNIYPKDKKRATMTIQHEKLASEAEAKKMKAYWGRQLTRLERLI